MADEYKVELPGDLKGLTVDTNHPDFKALTAVAREEGWSNKSFNRVIELEARRSMAKPAPAAPAPAPAAKPELPANFATLSTREQMHIALQRSDVARRGS
jgi:hypothetical protein